MLRITTIHSGEGAQRYFDAALSTADYYAKEPGMWGGKAAQRLGLEGRVQRKQFVSLSRNEVPGKKGERLTARTNTTREAAWDDPETGKPAKVANRRSGYDFTFSAPKSLSVYLAVNDDRAMEAMIKDAYRETMNDIENEIEVHTHGPTESHEVSGNLVYASFVHRETRPVGGIPDPHYHIHGFVFNATWREGEQRWTAIDKGETAANRTCYEALFFHRLADKLIAAGYGIRRTDSHFELASVSRELIEKFSKRTKLIEAEAKERYRKLEAEARALMKRTNMVFEDAFAQVVSQLGVRTREAKEAAKGISREDLVKNWKEQMTAAELECLDPVRVKGTPCENLLDVELAKHQAIEHSFANVSLKRDRHVEALLLRRGLGRVSISEAREFVFTDPRFMRPKAGSRFVTTKEVHADEAVSIEVAVAGQGKHQALGRQLPWSIENPLIAADPEQSAAIDYLLRSADLAISVHGPAGAWKTTFATEAIKAIETLSGRRVLVLAPSSSATDELRSLGFTNSETFQKFMSDPQIQMVARGQVLWIDESSFLSMRQGRWLLDFAKQHGCRVITPGDTRQHHSVDRGDWMRVMQRMGAIASAAITKIFRQQVPALREAIYEMSQERPEVGFDKLREFGAVHEVGDKEKRLREISALHVAAIKEQRSSLIVAPTHGECRAVAEAVRAAMKEEGLLFPVEHSVTRLERLNLTESQRRDAINYESGQVVEFHRIVKGVGENGRKERRFRSGEQWRVVNRAPTGGVLIEREGHRRFLPLEQAGKFNVYKACTLQVAVGDRLRMTKNFRSAGKSFRNNQSQQVTAISETGLITFDGGHQLDVAGGRLVHVDQGIAVTSYAAQGKTVDQVIVSAPVEAFSQVSQAQFYVSMSRARYSMHLFTDSAAALREAVCRPSKRLSPLEVMHARDQDLALHAELYRQSDRERNNGRGMER